VLGVSRAQAPFRCTLNMLRVGELRAVRVLRELHFEHALHGAHQRARRGDQTDAAFLLSRRQGRQRDVVGGVCLEHVDAVDLVFTAVF